VAQAEVSKIERRGELDTGSRKKFIEAMAVNWRSPRASATAHRGLISPM
jgi:hypothetical protein